jgi:hypothetical protein
MIVLSKWNGGAPAFRQFYRVGWGLAADVEPSPAARAPFAVGGAPEVLAALAADYRFLTVRDRYELEDYRTATLAALDRWQETWSQDVTIGGTTYTLNAAPADQVEFDKMKLAMQGLTDQTEQFYLFTTTGSAGPFAASDLAAALVQYGAALLRRVIQGPTCFNLLYEQVELAQSAADLDAISFG